MKNLFAISFLIFPLLSNADNVEIKNDHAKMIQQACASLMRNVMQEYGKSFFCKTDNALSENSNGAFLVENLKPNAIGHLIRFSELYYADTSNPIGSLHYSYNSGDLNSAISYIQAGGGLTQKQQDHLACRNALEQMKKNAENTNAQYQNKQMANTEYESVHRAQLDAISRIEKQCPAGIVLG